MNPKDALYWEINRVRSTRVPEPKPTLAGLAVLAVGVLLLVAVVYRLIEQWVRW